MPVHNKKIEKIGDRIREVRKTENLTQEEFALELGVKRGYISTLEIHGNEPSERLVLSICRIFGVSYDWLKNGAGNKYSEPKLLSTGRLLVAEIIKEIESPSIFFPIRELAEILDIDPHMPSSRLNSTESFRWAVCCLVRIFREGDPNKIEAILAQLKAFKPKFTIDPKSYILRSQPENFTK
jgi:transcriptional regulator with XRE-family HTH domain